MKGLAPKPSTQAYENQRKKEDREANKDAVAKVRDGKIPVDKGDDRIYTKSKHRPESGHLRRSPSPSPSPSPTDRQRSGLRKGDEVDVRKGDEVDDE